MIEPLIAEILADGETHSLPMLAVELEQEHPREFHAFVLGYARDYDLHGCGLRRGHINGLADVLGSMESRGLTRQSVCEGEVRWEQA